MEEREMLAVCRERFARIDTRLREGDRSAQDQRRELSELELLAARLNERMTALAGSMRALTKALWGVTAAALAGLFGFVLWYLQTR